MMSELLVLISTYAMVVAFVVIALGKFTVSLYFIMLAKKGNGLRKVMVRYSISGSVFFAVLGVVLIYKLSEWVSVAAAIPFAYFELGFVKYLFKSLRD